MYTQWEPLGHLGVDKSDISIPPTPLEPPYYHGKSPTTATFVPSITTLAPPLHSREETPQADHIQGKPFPTKRTSCEFHLLNTS